MANQRSSTSDDPSPAQTVTCAAFGTSSSQPGEVWIGRKLRDYLILEQIGRGGMGLVFKARHVRLDRLVALKILPVERFADAGAITRFEREMRAIGRLEHPNIVLARDAGENDGLLFLVMELLDGLDLEQLPIDRIG